MHFVYIISWNIRLLPEQAMFYFLFTHDHTKKVILCEQVYLLKNTLKITNSQIGSNFIDGYLNTST